jgi:hypothetical protein
LICVEFSTFSSCSSLKSIIILRHVQILCSSCFSCCTSFSSSSFEMNSQLTRIQSNTFLFLFFGQINHNS